MRLALVVVGSLAARRDARFDTHARIKVPWISSPVSLSLSSPLSPLLSSQLQRNFGTSTS